MLFLHLCLLFGDSHLPSFDTFRMQVTPTSNSRAFLGELTIWTPTSIRLGIEKASYPTSQHFMRFAGTIQAQQGIWACPYTNIFSATRRIHTIYSETLAYNKGQKVTSHTSQHLRENSWNHHGEANVFGFPTSSHL